jgi:arginyl-tRNA--protein-N-Asp/Glu arginylyltransferase
MKLIFSEAAPDYSHYIFPYVIWGFPEPGETIPDIFQAGFLPSSRLLDRFYMARQIRIRLGDFKPSSENRRILRKCPDISCELVERRHYDYTPSRRDAFKDYADQRFGKNVMTCERLDEIFRSPLVTHLLLFKLPDGAIVGTVVLYLHERHLAFYYYAFYDPALFHRNLGIYMMTSAIQFFASLQFKHLYLGTCYSERALYKTQFAGCEFFNGVCWNQSLDQLKLILRRNPSTKHLLEDEDYMRLFAPDKSRAWIQQHGLSFQLKASTPS